MKKESNDSKTNEYNGIFSNTANNCITISFTKRLIAGKILSIENGFRNRDINSRVVPI